MNRAPWEAVVAASQLADPPGQEIDVCPSHTREIFDIETMPKIARWAGEKVKEHQIDALVACGHSGLVLAGVVAYLTGVPLFAVRKPGEYTVAGSGPVSGYTQRGRARRWAWLDDFVGSGRTMVRSAFEVWREHLVVRPIPAVVLSYGRFESDPVVTIGDHRWAEFFKDGCYPWSVEEMTIRQVGFKERTW